MVGGYAAQDDARIGCGSWSSPTCDGPRTTSPRRPEAADGGPAPEGGTAEAAPRQRSHPAASAPRRPRTPTKRHQTPRDLPGILKMARLSRSPGDAVRSGLKCPSRPRSKVAYGREPASAPQPGGSPIPAIKGASCDQPRRHGGARGTADHRRCLVPGTGPGPGIRRRQAGSAGRTSGSKKTSGLPGTRGTFTARSGG